MAEQRPIWDVPGPDGMQWCDLAKFRNMLRAQNCPFPDSKIVMLFDAMFDKAPLDRKGIFPRSILMPNALLIFADESDPED